MNLYSISCSYSSSSGYREEITTREVLRILPKSFEIMNRYGAKANIKKSEVGVVMPGRLPDMYYGWAETEGTAAEMASQMRAKIRTRLQDEFTVMQRALSQIDQLAGRGEENV